MLTSSRRLLLPLLLALTSLAACDNSEEAAEQRLEDYAKQYGLDVDVELDNENGVASMTMQNPDGEGTLSFGQDVEVPDGFPDDVALYPDLQIFTSNTSSGITMVQGFSGDAADDVLAFYKERMAAADWTLEETPQNFAVAYLQFTKDSRTATVSVLPGDRITVSVTIQSN